MSVPHTTPPPLAPGARVALLAPAGPLANEADLVRAEENVRALGWEPHSYPHALARDGYLAGDDASRLADLSHTVVVLTGDASTGVCTQFVGDLASLRPGAELLKGNEVAISRRLSQIQKGDTVVAVDLRRYDRWVVEAATEAKRRGAWLLALTDSALSPLAGIADASMVLTAGGIGPFDSHVGTLALLNVLVAAAAEQLRDTATERLDRAEAAWSARSQLIDR